MTLRKRHLPLLIASLILVGCNDRQERAQSALDQYQSALASGDLAAAKAALGLLVKADDTNAGYWTELAKLSLTLEDYPGAYDAFVRAHELNRANVEVLSALTQLALRSGNLPLAEQHSRELAILSPDDPAVSLTMSYVALQRSDYARARELADELLRQSPYDPSAKILSARIFLAEGESTEAIALLEEQVRLQPSDWQSLHALASIYEVREQWAEASASGRKLLQWRPQDQQARARLINAELRAGQVEQALATTLTGLQKVEQIDMDRTLWPWLALGRSSQIADEILAFGNGEKHGRRIASARFLALAEKPAGVLELLRDQQTKKVDASSASVIGLLGTALTQSGKVTSGLQMLEQVLTFDGANADALRGRAEARSRLGRHQQAIEDAQKLVAGNSDSVAARLLLARIHGRAGDGASARRALWDAFHELPGERTIFEALMPLVAASYGPQAVNRLKQEFLDQQNQKMIRSLA